MRPPYVPEDMEFSAILRMRDRFRDNLIYEMALHDTMVERLKSDQMNPDLRPQLEAAAAAQDARVQALDYMIEEVSQWARVVRAHERMGPSFAGFRVNQPVSVNKRRGRVASFKPTFEPTHIMVLFEGSAEPKACLPVEVKPL